MHISLSQLIDDIKEQDIKLLAAKYSENKFIDFKECSPIPISRKSSDTEKRKFMTDVMAFANAYGGYLLYGLKEEEKKPIEFVPFEIKSVEQFEGTIGNIINDWLQPQLYNYQLESIPVGNGAYIVVLHVPMSRNAPHGVWRPGSGHAYFAERTDEGSNRPYNHQTLKSKIVMMENVNARMKVFRDDRIELIVKQHTPIPLVSRPRLVMHLLPLASFYQRTSYDMRTDKFDSHDLCHASDRYWRGSNKRQNFDGYLVYSAPRKSVHDGYVQLFRNGCIEVVETGIFDNGFIREGRLIISGNDLERFLIFSFYKCTNVLDQIGVVCPIYCSLSLIGVYNYLIGGGTNWNPYQPSLPIDRDTLDIPEFEFMDVPAGMDSAAVMLKDTIDLVWNSSGWDASPNYDVNGEYKCLGEANAA